MGVARLTPLYQQSLQRPLSILLDSRHPSSPNQHSCSPSPLASSTSSLVVLTFSCPSLQTPMNFSKHVIIPPQHMPIRSWILRSNCFEQPSFDEGIMFKPSASYTITNFLLLPLISEKIQPCVVYNCLLSMNKVFFNFRAKQQ